MSATPINLNYICYSRDTLAKQARMSMGFESCFTQSNHLFDKKGLVLEGISRVLQAVKSFFLSFYKPQKHSCLTHLRFAVLTFQCALNPKAKLQQIKIKALETYLHRLIQGKDPLKLVYGKKSIQAAIASWDSQKQKMESEAKKTWAQIYNQFGSKEFTARLEKLRRKVVESECISSGCSIKYQNFLNIFTDSNTSSFQGIGISKMCRIVTDYKSKIQSDLRDLQVNQAKKIDISNIKENEEKLLEKLIPKEWQCRADLSSNLSNERLLALFQGLSTNSQQKVAQSVLAVPRLFSNLWSSFHKHKNMIQTLVLDSFGKEFLLRLLIQVIQAAKQDPEIVFFKASIFGTQTSRNFTLFVDAFTFGIKTHIDQFTPSEILMLVETIADFSRHDVAGKSIYIDPIHHCFYDLEKNLLKQLIQKDPGLFFKKTTSSLTRIFTKNGYFRNDFSTELMLLYTKLLEKGLHKEFKKALFELSYCEHNLVYFHPDFARLGKSYADLVDTFFKQSEGLKKQTLLLLIQLSPLDYELPEADYQNPPHVREAHNALVDLLVFELMDEPEFVKSHKATIQKALSNHLRVAPLNASCSEKTFLLVFEYLALANEHSLDELKVACLNKTLSMPDFLEFLIDLQEKFQTDFDKKIQCYTDLMHEKFADEVFSFEGSLKQQKSELSLKIEARRGVFVIVQLLHMKKSLEGTLLSHAIHQLLLSKRNLIGDLCSEDKLQHLTMRYKEKIRSCLECFLKEILPDGV